MVAVKAVLVFATICTLWSLWQSPTLGDWLDIMSVQRFGLVDAAAVAGILALIAIGAFVGEMTGRSQGDVDRVAAPGRGTAAATTKGWLRPALSNGGQLALLALVSLPVIMERTNAGVQQFARDLRVPELNKRDAAALQRGYYENLQGVSLQNNQLWELYAQRPAEGQDIWKSGVLRERDDFLAREMKENFGIFQSGKSFRTNRWGMRDHDYELAKPTGTRRIALLGQSYVAGDGVGDGETFDELVEARLAREGAVPPIQVLNFGVGSYSLFQQLLMLQDRVWRFEPDAVMIVGHPGDAERLAIHLVQQVRRGVQPPFPAVQQILARAQVTADVRETEAMSRLLPLRDELMAWTLREIVTVARARNVTPVWVYLSTPERGPTRAEIDAMARQATAAGFAVLDWSDVYDGVDIATVQASQWDFHPNAAGHELIAQRFYRDLTSTSTFGNVRPSATADTKENRR